MDIKFIIYEKTTGKIKQYGSCSESMFEQQCLKDEGILNVEQYPLYDEMIDINNGEVIKRASGDLQIEAIAENLSFDNNKLQQAIDEKINEILKRMAIDELKKEGKL